MAHKYLVKGVPHFRDGSLYPVGAVFTLEKPIENIKDWLYLEEVVEAAPPKKAEEPKK